MIHTLPQTDKARVLVVDDDPLVQRLIRNVLKDFCHVEGCTTYHEVLNAYDRLEPDVVFLDIDLGDSEVNGFDILNTLKLHDADANIVMLTGNDSPSNINQAVYGGANGFIAKPCKPDRLLQMAASRARPKG